MPLFRSSASPDQIDRGGFLIHQGANQSTLVGYVYSDTTNEWWVLRTATPAYTWPSSPVGTSTTTTYLCTTTQTFATPAEFYQWVQDESGWSPSDYETVECSCQLHAPS